MELNWQSRTWNTNQSTTKRSPIQLFAATFAFLILSQVTDEHSASGAESSADVASTAASGTLAGLDFDVLNVRYPDHVAQLKELADSLQGDTIQDLQQEVKVWAIRELGLQAVQAAHSSSQPLNTLRELAHNLPARASALSRTVVSQDVRSAVANVQQM